MKAVNKTVKHLKKDNKECKEEIKEHNKLVKGLKKKK
jgi:hypothetical protein